MSDKSMPPTRMRRAALGEVFRVYMEQKPCFVDEEKRDESHDPFPFARNFSVELPPSAAVSDVYEGASEEFVLADRAYIEFSNNASRVVPLPLWRHISLRYDVVGAGGELNAAAPRFCSAIGAWSAYDAPRRGA